MRAALIAPMEITGQPLRLEALLGQGLEHPRLIGAQRTAALQHEHPLGFVGPCTAET